MLEKALEERIRCEKKYPHDLGVKEDLVKNIAEIIGLRCRHAIELETCRAAISERMEFIRQKEGHSPRIKYLEEK